VAALTAPIISMNLPVVDVNRHLGNTDHGKVVGGALMDWQVQLTTIR
jgi:hypothetical protein